MRSRAYTHAHIHTHTRAHLFARLTFVVPEERPRNVAPRGALNPCLVRRS